MRFSNIVILTGAGISAESGISTFRDADGLWMRHNIEDVATPQGFARNPKLVLEFYNARRRSLPQALPNAAHRALARLEAAGAEQGASVWLVTQNVDDLHERAGSRNLIHMHGELASALCGGCGLRTPCADDLSAASVCPACGATGLLRPDVVWFGEYPYRMGEIDALLSGCDLFVSIGTSGEVYPAAGFVRQARAAGARTIELNLERSSNAFAFAEGRYGPATQVVPGWVEEVLAERF
jgi:NAD-dependent deacetylase